MEQDLCNPSTTEPLFVHALHLHLFVETESKKQAKNVIWDTFSIPIGKPTDVE